MKCLFLQFLPLKSEQGITHKILAQVNALKSLGLDTMCARMETLNNRKFFYVEGECVDDLGAGAIGSLNYLCRFSGFLRYIDENAIKFVYIRYILTANPFFIRFLRKLKERGVVIFLEIPTYPYEKEFGNSLKSRLISFIEHYSRKSFCRYIDRIVTSSLYNLIFGVKTINLSNSVDIDTIPLRHPSEHKEFVIVAVAVLCFWHGYDRLIASIGEYYKKGGRRNIQFYIIGSGDKYIREYYELAVHYNVQNHIHLEGPKIGDELNPYFDHADLAVGCLACHRKGIKEVKSLKNVEYGARGIPFIYSEDNSDFDRMPYIMKVAPDDSIFELDDIIEFVDKMQLTEFDIRKTVDPVFTWKYQMGKVVNEYNAIIGDYQMSFHK